MIEPEDKTVDLVARSGKMNAKRQATWGMSGGETQMSFIDSIKCCFSNYLTFSGRASRSEYWWFTLFFIVGVIILTILDISMFGTTIYSQDGIRGQTNFAPFTSAFSLLIFLPSISVLVRRLHDTDRTGWWYWIILIPVVGIILMLVWLASRGTRGDNRYGSDPL